jgi:uncharacterized protein YnzC (UPF0291/DUF896 family)
MEKMINRINELARKAKTTGLSDEESAEQKQLRNEYIQAVTGNMRKQLNNIKFVDEQGNEYDIKGKQ